MLADGKTAIITKNIVEHLDEPQTTYNFEVADSHTYYVGEQGILVHNSCKPTSPQKLTNYQIERAGIEEHAFKQAALKGTQYSRMSVSRFDIFVDKVDDLLWLGTKKGQFQIWIETGAKLL